MPATMVQTSVHGEIGCDAKYVFGGMAPTGVMLVQSSASVRYPVTRSVCLEMNLVRIKNVCNFNWLKLNSNSSEMRYFKT